MASLPLKVSRNEQRAVFVFVGKKTYCKWHFSQMRSVYGDKCFMRRAIYVWCQKFSRGRESVVDDDRPGRQVVATTDDC